MIGSAYEACVVDALAAHGYVRRRRGGPGDAGIDLIGRFELFAAAAARGGAEAPCAAAPVVGQCKAEARPLGPAAVREFEGVMALQRAGGAEHSGWGNRAGESSGRSLPCVGIIVSASSFSPAARLLCANSLMPILLLHVLTTGELRSVLSSRTAQELLPTDVFDAMTSLRVRRAKTL